MAVWFWGMRRSPQMVSARAYSATVWPQYTSARCGMKRTPRASAAATASSEPSLRSR